MAAWRYVRSAVALMTLGMTAGLNAQTSPQQDSAPTAGDIVVEGRPLPEEARVRALARAISPRTGYDQPLARFSDPVCFATAGLARPMLLTVADRLVQNAQAAGLRLGGDGCDPNVMVLFTDDGRADLKATMKRHPGLFRNQNPNEIRAILDEPGPVHVWSTSETRGADGERMFYDSNGIPSLRIPTATRIRLMVRRDMLSTVVLIDREAVPGHSLRQVADYAAMRTLAMIRPKGATGGDTILTLFDPDQPDPPTEMTAFDRGYLKALYEGSGAQRGATKVAMIGHSIVWNGKAATPALAEGAAPVPAPGK